MQCFFFGEGDDVAEHCQLFLAHCASRSAAAGVHKARYNFLMLSSNDDCREGALAVHVTQDPIQTQRCLPCFREAPSVGRLSQYNLDGFVAHVLKPSIMGPALRVECFRVSHKKLDADKFVIGGRIDELVVAAAVVPAGGAADETESDLDWFGECSHVLAPSAAGGSWTLFEEEMAILNPDRVMALEVQHMLEDEADIVDDGEGAEAVEGDAVGLDAMVVAPEHGGDEAPEPEAAVVPVDLADCFNSLWHIKTAAEAAALCGCTLLPSWAIQRDSDLKELGRFKVTFEGRTLQIVCRMHPACKILAQIGPRLAAVESALAKWLLAGQVMSKEQHSDYGAIIKRSIREGRIAI